jgi:hypothetical protein
MAQYEESNEPGRVATLLCPRGVKAALAGRADALSASMNLGWTHEDGDAGASGFACGAMRCAYRVRRGWLFTNLIYNEGERS